jgi:hypothetical protein
MHKQLAVLVSVLLGVMVTTGSPAGAKPIERGDFTDSYDLVHENFCGVPGLTVSDIGTIKLRFRVNTQGRAGLPHYAENLREQGTVTDLNTGNSVTYSIVANSKDLQVTDNHDGTISIISFGTGTFTVADADGKALGRNPGQGRHMLLIDTNGTPNDFSDDELLGDEVLKESTGRNDNTCAAFLEGLGVDAP